jgi:hypothetical protein
MFGAHSRPRHPRVTIGIREINIPRDEHLLVVRAPRRQNERAQEEKFNDRKRTPRKSSHKIDNDKSRNQNRKIK